MTFDAAPLEAAPPRVLGNLRIRSLEAFALEVPLGRTVANPVLAFSSSVALLIRALDDDGVEGWGEVWCNFPRFGVRHRARLVSEVFAPMLSGRSFASPAEAWEAMTSASRILRLQSGEPGPIAAAIAGIDIALCDLAAKRAEQPLWRWLGGARGRVRVYASLGRADPALPTLERWLARGFTAFKLRSSGALADHVAVVRPARTLVGDACELMLDVNSSWDPELAIATVGELREHALAWLEEPIPADEPAEIWRRLARAAPMPLAGGENLITAATFDAVLAEGSLAVLQPDITKWGGISGGMPLARRIVASGRRFCPHMFTGAPGVLASAHLLAAADAPDGMLEFGVGPNPARDAMLDRVPDGGTLELGEAPGLGLEVDLRRLAPYLVQP
ncbi:MAG: mandelate racemase/muconate lactonizing enzyme family protein [Burkholderiales bacterium]|nr:mandelate racemase/muconate lactonizing enzyme family protein [Burkholderiales bacterium]